MSGVLATPHDVSALCGGSCVSAQAVQRLCEELERGLLHDPGFAALRAGKSPGSAKNPGTDGGAWLSYYGQLHRLHAGGVVAPSMELPRWSEQDAQDLQAALYEKPVHVPMADGTTRPVYPKGNYAMDRVSMLDAELRWVVPRRVAIEATLLQDVEPTPEALEALARFQEHQHRLEREFLWIVTHPGSDVPWPDDGQREHMPPAWTRVYDGHDLILARAAYIEVSYSRQRAIVARTHAFAGAGAETMSPDAFAAIMASEAGIPTSQFAHEWSHGMASATAFYKWESLQKAEAKARAAA